MARYGDEFEALLDERPLGPLDVADILLGAFDAQLRLRGHETAIAHGEGFIMSLRIGGIAAILGAALWAAAGLVNSGIFAHADATLPSVMLAAGLPIRLIAMAGLSAFQARTNPTLSWVAFLVPAVGAVACLVGMVGIAAGATSSSGSCSRSVAERRSLDRLHFRSPHIAPPRCRAAVQRCSALGQS